MIIVDVETTGTNPAKNSLVSIGAVNFDAPLDQFYEECQIWDGAHIEPAAMEVNGFTEEQIRDTKKPTEAETLKNFLVWIESKQNQIVVAQNPMFDLGFLQAAAYRAGVDYKLAHRSLDIHTLAFMHMIKKGIEPPINNGKSNINSDGIMKYVGIPTEPRPHIAINGAVWEAEALSRLLYGKNLFSQFKDYPVIC
ncbi:MAG TPA: 3'-5' exonuclease [Candidatus Nanoarchaeia archaeon]|nr:3'-5' exonuclease [Candidatus Nanoarchaeia archaeon]